MTKNRLCTASLALAALALSACSNEDFEGINALPGDGSVAFSSYIPDSRGAVASADNLASFGVFASHHNGQSWASGDKKPNFMYNQQVNRNGDTWAYSPIKYWPAAASEKVSFFAYAPYVDAAASLDNSDTGVTALSANSTAGDPAISYQVGTDVASHQDLLYAKVIDATNVNPTVNLNFNHALSRVAFRIKGWEDSSTAYDANTTVTVNSVKIATTRKSATLNLNSGEWSDPIDDSTLRAYTLAPSLGNIQNNVIASGSTDVKLLNADDDFIFMLPDLSGSDQYVIFMDYTVTTADDNLKDGNIVVRNNIFKRFTPHFEAGKAYAITVHIGMNGYEGDDDSDEDGTIPVDPDPLPDSPDLTPASLHTEVGFTTEVTPWDAEYDLDLSSGHIPNELDWYPWFIGYTADNADFNYTLYNRSNVAESAVPEILYTPYTSTANMFKDRSDLIALDLSHMPTAGVTDMKSMFQNCSNISELNISNFDFSNVTNISNMFNGMSSLKTLNLHNADFSNVTFRNGYRGVLDGCDNLTSLSLENVIVNNEIKSISEDFANFLRHKTLTELKCKNFTTNATSFGTLFQGSNLKKIDLEGWDTENVTNMNRMFHCCGELEEVNVADFNTSNVTSFSEMFGWCTKLKSVNLSNFDFSKATTMLNMFSGCSSLTDISFDGATFNSDEIHFARGIFNGCTCLKNVSLNNVTALDINAINSMVSGVNYENLSIKNLKTNSTNFYQLFFRNKCKTIDVSGWNVENVQSFSNMFSTCSNLESIDLSSWHTKKVNDVGFMFTNCPKLKFIDLSNFYVTDEADEVHFGTYAMFGYPGQIPDSLVIKTNKAFQQWLLDRKNYVGLPKPLWDPNSDQWIIIDE